MNFYRIVQFNTQRRFHARLYVRVSDSGHPVTYSRQFCRNKPIQKIHCCMSVRFTQHHTLLHNPTILHMKICFSQTVTRARYTAICQHAPHYIIRFYINLLFYIQLFSPRQPVTRPRKIFHFKIGFKHTSELNNYLITSLGLGLGLWLQSNQTLTPNWYTSLHATTRVSSYFYFYVLCK